jgi:hypothetical protein
MSVYSKLIIKYLCVLICTFQFYANSFAQDDLNGLWVVEKVMVGEEVMTPVAKWFEFEEDGRYKSGNGWLQNSSGTYQWDPKSNELKAFDSLAIADKYGAFQVELTDSSMSWTREEEGNEVKVYAKRGSEIPMAPQDLLVGMWELDMPDSTSKALADHIYFRWDRRVLWWQDGKRSIGLWNFNAHRPILLTIIQNQETRWEVQVDTERLYLKDISTKTPIENLEYQRIDHFPN